MLRLAPSGFPARVALVVAHPGHELRLHGWLELARPDVFVLTDGSGRCGRSRIESTTRLIERAGCRRGAIYGRMSDLALYSAVLTEHVELFLNLADELAAAFVAGEYDWVVGDAAEGAILAHDLWRAIIDTAITLAEGRLGRPLANLDFPIDGPPNDCPEELRPKSLWLELEEHALTRKLRAALDYPELAKEVHVALQTLGRDAFRDECLRPVARLWQAGEWSTAPEYERHGEQQVAAGHYPEVVRYEQTVLPIVRALRLHAQCAEHRLRAERLQVA